MTARIYIDEDSMDRVLVAALRARGVDVLTALEADMIERDDAEHLAFATSSKRVLLTCNTGDFCQLHQDWLTAEEVHSGIVCMQQQAQSTGPRLRRLLRLFSTIGAEEMQNRLEFLNNWSE
ncbi:MAG: DUF5615 family PIN-like protein [Schlesneria sp.]